jgi:hypothetical protein
MSYRVDLFGVFGDSWLILPNEGQAVAEEN